jgi:glycosyltransferase involved in cell wall biosynthesis
MAWIELWQFLAVLKTTSNSRNVLSEPDSGPLSVPRLLYVVSEDWYFLSHRLPMARAACNAGFEVHVATRVQKGAAAIEAEGFVLHRIPFARGRLSPIMSLRTMLALRRIHRTVAPSITHHVTVQTAVLGMIAALDRPGPCVNSINGLGYTFTSTSVKAALFRTIMRSAFRKLFDRQRMINLVQNDDDRRVVTAAGISESRIALIAGSGVDTAKLLPIKEPPGPPTAAFVGRLLDDKGIRTLVAAHQLVREQEPEAQLLIAGAPDSANPTSVSHQEAISWNSAPGITWLGQVDDIANLWARAHVAVLPSRREGLPLSLLEAAACGRAMVATDVPGCQEIAIAGKTGLLVPVDDARALANAICRLFREPQLRTQFALAARRLVVERFSAEIVGQQTVALYRSLLAS